MARQYAFAGGRFFPASEVGPAWPSVVHAAIMAVQALNNPQYFGHLYGDVPALFVVAAVLAWLSLGALLPKARGNAT